VAYLTYLASAPPAEVTALRVDHTTLLTPSLVVAVSHLIASWVQVQPLGELLGQAIDGGTELNSALWHPLRPPCYHEPEAVRALHAQLTEAWQRTLAAQSIPEDDWYRVEIEKVLRIFGHAAERGDCVVSALQAPFDAERAARVRIPFPLESRVS
jgi:hypothetical protein